LSPCQIGIWIRLDATDSIARIFFHEFLDVGELISVESPTLIIQFSMLKQQLNKVG
jgi:hypothetical protein